MNREITVKQRDFVSAYLVDFKSTKAARRAGYRGSKITLSSH
jgi:phage terminase small subunit